MEKSIIFKMTSRFLLSTFLILVLIINQSCEKEEVNEEEDCRYLFSENLDNIFGTWEPEFVINLETGDSIFYDLGIGHQGHMFKSWYSDSVELRDNGEFEIFYTIDGKPCKDEVTGNWIFENSNMSFIINRDTINISVLLIEENKLIIEDIINTVESQVIMRRIN